jgi:hypothetical protein
MHISKVKGGKWLKSEAVGFMIWPVFGWTSNINYKFFI